MTRGTTTTLPPTLPPLPPSTSTLKLTVVSPFHIHSSHSPFIIHHSFTPDHHLCFFSSGLFCSCARPAGNVPPSTGLRPHRLQTLQYATSAPLLACHLLDCLGGISLRNLLPVPMLAPPEITQMKEETLAAYHNPLLHTKQIHISETLCSSSSRDHHLRRVVLPCQRRDFRGQLLIYGPATRAGSEMVGTLRCPDQEPLTAPTGTNYNSNIIAQIGFLTTLFQDIVSTNLS